jgi:excisionase family DNA binding protein
MARALIGTADTAAALKVSEEVVRRWHSAGRIPGYRCGRLLRFDLDEVLDALRSNESSNARANGTHIEPDFAALDE